MLNTSQVAALLGVKPRTIRDWRLRYALPYYRIGAGRRGGTILFNETEVREWLAGFKNQKAAILV